MIGLYAGYQIIGTAQNALARLEPFETAIDKSMDLNPVKKRYTISDLSSIKFDSEKMLSVNLSESEVTVFTPNLGFANLFKSKTENLLIRQSLKYNSFIERVTVSFNLTIHTNSGIDMILIVNRINLKPPSSVKSQFQPDFSIWLLKLSLKLGKL